MKYPENIEDSLELVRKTRTDRLTKTVKRIPPEEREGILRRYHPDYREGAKRILKVGPNSGEMMVNGFADLL